LRVELDLMSPEEAIDLLARRVGDRVTADPAGAAALAARCAYLPLALCIAVEYLVRHPHASPASLAAGLADADHTLDMLDAGGEPRTAVRHVFSWSYRALPRPTARAFRLFGVPVTADLDRYAAAALLDMDLRATGRVLDHLVRGHLLREDSPGRYGMHDLLRAYAREQAYSVDGPETTAAERRLATHFLAAASAAMDVLLPHERHHRPRLAPSSRPLPPLDDDRAATEWLSANLANLVATVVVAAEHGSPETSTALAQVLRRYLDNSGYHPEAIRVHGSAVRAAVLSGDRVGEAHARRHLAIAHSRLGRIADAVAEFRHALEIFQAAGDRLGTATALNSLGVAAWLLGDYEPAVDSLSRAHELLSEEGEHSAAADALSNLSATLERWGRLDDALRYGEQALTTYIKVGDRAGTARTLGNLGIVFEKVGRYDEALDHYRRSLDGYDELGSRTCLGRVMGGIASTYRRLGRYDDAIDTANQALIAARQVGDRGAEAEVFDVLGMAYRQAGCLADARRQHQFALAIARDIDDRYQQARALDGMGRVEYDAGAHTAARDHWRAALAMYEAMNLPEADDVRARLREA
jgi:tetratricopeptide (TPR) repeat protein